MPEAQGGQGETLFVNVEDGLARLRGNKKMYARMLGLFLKSPEFAQLDAQLDERDYAKAADTAHAIKGMTGNLSLDLLFALSTRLMNELRAGQPDPQTLQDYKDMLSKTWLAAEQTILRLEQEA